MNWLGIDLEVNKKGIWNVGLAVFSGTKCIDYVNFFISETFSENPEDGFGQVYFKSRNTISKSKRPVWVRNLEDADTLASLWIRAHGFSRSFGYNSKEFDLAKMQDTLPNTLKLIQSKPHVDVMPLAVEYLVTRASYKKYWEAQVALGNTHEGNKDYAKFSAELVLNYIGDMRYKKEGKTWIWRKEPHIGAEDLIGFEYPILHYFMRILKQKMAVDNNTSFLKW